MTTNLLAISMPGGMEWLVILIVGLLIFGRRLPDVARSIGKSITEFKKGMKDVQDDIHTSLDADDARPGRLDRERATLARKDSASSDIP